MASKRNMLYVYYFFFPDEEDKFLALVRNLSAHPLPDHLADYIPSETEPDISVARYRFSSLDRLEILILRFTRDSESLVDAENYLQDMEHKSSLSGENWLGKVVLRVVPADAPEIPRGSLRDETSRFVIGGIELTRFCKTGATYEVFYESRVNTEKEAQARFLLEKSLPLAEAYLAQIHLVANTYRDSAQTVLEQVNESGRRLSAILYSPTGDQAGDSNAIRELEDQLHELSVSYGQLVASYNFLREGRNKIQDLTRRLGQHLRTEMGLASGDATVLDITGLYQTALRLIERAVDELHSLIDNYRAAIEVVRGRIEILMSRESASLQNRIKNVLELNTSLQKQSLTFQVAASFIEFIVLDYYTHSLWKNLAPGAYAHLPKWIQFLLTSLLAGTAVYATHLIAERIQGEHHVNRRLRMVMGALVAIFVIIVVLSAIYSGYGAPASH